MKSWYQSKSSLLITYLALSVLAIVYIISEYNHSYDQLLTMKKNEATILINTVNNSLCNTTMANEEVANLLVESLAAKARFLDAFPVNYNNQQQIIFENLDFVSIYSNNSISEIINNTTLPAPPYADITEAFSFNNSDHAELGIYTDANE